MTRIQLSAAATLFHQDCREAIKALPDNSIDSCCTDPPYALVSVVKRFGGENAAPAQHGTDGAFARASRGFMGQTWDTGETAFSTEFWAEVYRVLKPGAFVAAFGASRGYHRMACAIEDAGFEIRDSLMWIYGTGFPKSHDVSKGIDREAGAVRTEIVGHKMRPDGKTVLSARANGFEGSHEGWDRPWKNDPAKVEAQGMQYKPATPQAVEWEGWGTALKPAFEPIVLARKPLSEPTVAANVLRWRTGALNIDGCRVPTADGDSNARVYTAKRTAPGATQNATGERHLEVVEYEGASKDGRWPANVVTDGSDEVVAMFPRQAGASAPVRGNEPSDASNGDVTGKRARVPGAFHGDSGSAARFFYSTKASKADRAGSKHPTVKPIGLMEWLATLITPPGGTILDPFAGSGTTGIAATRKGFRVILCEREAEYVADIRSRFGTPRAPVRDYAALAALQARLSARA